MNFDDIKQAMDHDNTELSVPLSLKQIKTSHSSLNKLKRWIKSDLLALLTTVGILVVLFFKPSNHQLANVLFHYTASISIIALIGFIALQVRLLRQLNIGLQNSRREIERLLVQIKSYFEVSKYITTGLAASFFIPCIVYSIGKKQDHQYITDFLTFRLSMDHMLPHVGYLVLFIAVVFFGGSLLFKLFPEKEIHKLESTLDHF
jgi:hypothetical protein